MNSPNDGVGRLGAVFRALSAHEPAGGTTSAVARSAQLPRPTVHRLLVSLFAEGLVDRDAEGQWFLGPELYLLGTAASARYDVTAIAQPVVRKLAVATGESAFFSARRGDETVCLVREDGSFPIRSHVLYEGIRLPLGVASAGMAILAHLPDHEVDAFLTRTGLSAEYGDSHSDSAIREQICATRTAGYSVNPGLLVEGSWGMGAAIFDADERPQWALSLTGVEQRFNAVRQPSLGRLLMDAAHHVSSTLRASGRASGQR